MSPGRHRSRPVQTASEKIGPDEDLNLKSSIGQSGLDCAIESASRDWWYQGAMVAVQQLARSGRGFDVDHVASLTGEPPAAVYWGALFAVRYQARRGRGSRLPSSRRRSARPRVLGVSRCALTILSATLNTSVLAY